MIFGYSDLRVYQLSQSLSAVSGFKKTSKWKLKLFERLIQVDFKISPSRSVVIGEIGSRNSCGFRSNVIGIPGVLYLLMRLSKAALVSLRVLWDSGARAVSTWFQLLRIAGDYHIIQHVSLETNYFNQTTRHTPITTRSSERFEWYHFVTVYPKHTTVEWIRFDIDLYIYIYILNNLFLQDVYMKLYYELRSRHFWWSV